jgi:hypothetical protein
VDAIKAKNAKDRADAEMAREAAEVAETEAKKAAAKVAAREADRLQLRLRTFKRMIFNATAAQELADPIDPVMKRLLTAGEKTARSSLEEANARPDELASGNKKLERHYQANAARGDKARSTRAEASSSSETTAQRAELRGLLVEPSTTDHRTLQMTLTLEEKDARSTLSRARASPELVASGNRKVKALNDRLRRDRAPRKY